MWNNRAPTDACLIQAVRRTGRRSREAALAMSSRQHDAVPTDRVPCELPADTYALLLARYRPVEALTKQWIAMLREPTTQIYGLQLYHTFVETYRCCWPAWPPYPRLPLGVLDAQDLIGFDGVAVATIEWVEWSDQELIPGILALTLLCRDLHPALAAALLELAAAPRELLWRP